MESLETGKGRFQPSILQEGCEQEKVKKGNLIETLAEEGCSGLKPNGTRQCISFNDDVKEMAIKDKTVLNTTRVTF